MVSKLKTPTCKCPTEDDCPRDVDPVCGSDGRSYINPCRMNVEACNTEQPLVVIKKGVCGKDVISVNQIFVLLQLFLNFVMNLCIKHESVSSHFQLPRKSRR